MKDSIIISIISMVFIVAIAIGGFYVKRWFNATFYYNSASEAVVCKMVKPEYLKNPQDCD